MTLGTAAPVVLWCVAVAATLPLAGRRLSTQQRLGPVIALVAMGFLWQLPVPHLPGLPVHLLGVTAAALICGPSVAFLQVSLLAVVFGVPGGESWPDTALYCLAAGALPAAATAGLLVLARHRLPPNVFIFIFVNAFLAAALGMGFYVGIRELLLGDEGSLRRAFELALLLPLPEAIITGMIIAPLVAFRSELVGCFDADRHFGPGIR